MAAWMQLRARLEAPRDASGLVAFRVMFGTLMLVASLRFLSRGWIERFYEQPRFLFHYLGADWVRPLPAPAMSALYLAMALCALLIALGALYRVATITF